MTLRILSGNGALQIMPFRKLGGKCHFFLRFCTRKRSKTYGTACWFHIIINGLFTLPDTDSGTDSDSDSKPDGYMVRCKICSHCTDSNSDSYLDSDPQLLLYQILGRISEPGLGCISMSGSVNKP